MYILNPPVNLTVNMKQSLQQCDVLPRETDYSVKTKVIVRLDLSSFCVYCS